MRKTRLDSSAQIDRLVALLISGVVLAVYALTLCRTIYQGDDDGDFITCMATFGNSHPTGYPLFILAGHLFLVLLSPLIREPAVRINLLTALCGAAAAGFFYRFLATGVQAPRYAAGTAALLLAFSPTLWQLSNSCEVYVPNCMFLCALLFLTARWSAKPSSNRRLTGLAATYGLACTNHLSITLFLPAFAMFVLWRRPSLLGRDVRVLPGLIAAFVLPLLLYAYLPLSARYAHSPLNWGDPSTPERFWQKVSGLQYRNLMFTGVPQFMRGMRSYAASCSGEFPLWLLWLAPVGVAALWKRNRALCLLLAYILVADVIFAANYAIVNVRMYYLPSYVAIAAFLCAGADRCITWLWDALKRTPEDRERVTPLAAVVFLAVAGVNMSMHWQNADEHANYLSDDFVQNVLRAAPPHALVVFGDSNVETAWYHAFVVRDRTDVVPIDRKLIRGADLQTLSWYYDHLANLYPPILDAYPGQARPTLAQSYGGAFLADVIRRALANGVPVLWVPVDSAENAHDPALQYGSYAALVRQNFVAVNWGPCERLCLPGQQPSPDALFDANARIWESMRYHDLADSAHFDTMHVSIPLRYYVALNAWAAECERRGRYELARNAYAKVCEIYDLPAAEDGLQRCQAHLRTSTRALSR